MFRVIYIYTIHSQMDLLVFKTKRFGEWYNHFKDFGEVNNRQCFQKTVSENFEIETERFKHKAVDDQTKAYRIILPLSERYNLALLEAYSILRNIILSVRNCSYK